MSKKIQKRIVTNSMLKTVQICRKKYYWRYIKQIVPSGIIKAPAFGDLFHRLVNSLVQHNHTDYFDCICEKWLEEQITKANSSKASSKFLMHNGTNGNVMVGQTKETAIKIIEDCYQVVMNYKRMVLDKEGIDRYKNIFLETPFSVPLIDRSQRIHQYWRLHGRWDFVGQDLKTNQVLIRDFKTTTKDVVLFADSCCNDTQPRAYIYAAYYLALMKKALQFNSIDLISAMEDEKIATIIKKSIYPDFPYWPTDISAPAGFEVEVIRKKVPQKPQLIKAGNRLSKAITDTTFELYMEAIVENGLNPADYSDILDRLYGNTSYWTRQRIPVTYADIESWLEQVRRVLWDVRRIEREPFRIYKAEHSICLNIYGRRCPYYQLCYEDESIALQNFVHCDAHIELKEENDGNS